MWWPVADGTNLGPPSCFPVIIRTKPLSNDRLPISSTSSSKGQNRTSKSNLTAFFFISWFLTHDASSDIISQNVRITVEDEKGPLWYKVREKVVVSYFGLMEGVMLL
ncbi:hypothetical protein FS842_008755 [Serendipita sp. 407]|nr:hypothetical protein FS842_008755 [Serendipita sp. 407]